MAGGPLNLRWLLEVRGKWVDDSVLGAGRMASSRASRVAEQPWMSPMAMVRQVHDRVAILISSRTPP